jgi:hypothetical protein
MAKFRPKFNERRDVKYNLGALWKSDELDAAAKVLTLDDVKLRLAKTANGCNVGPSRST